ncbi:hypothetical protein SLEP1_g25229 [Rubroshorea leprosula]|uniref:Transposase-associated domain-containing protein n=1 Tax=Rubroshorea leprosula TaxID=152421 RepID=A0AAV5JI93_9ROSI|nr:hypothetical protein SLEP1_g25229 [Rubroshorea leprosula]
MTDDHRWMYRRRGPRGDCDAEFFNGLQQFFDFVYSHPGVHLNAEIRCPCSKCGNLPHHNKATIIDHLLRYGFMDAYSAWWAHGETLSNNVDPWSTTSDVAFSSNIEEHVNVEEHVNADIHHMVYDAFCPSEDDRPRNETEFASENVGDAPNRHAQSFYDLLRASTIPLGPSSNNQTLLGWLSYMLHCKAKNNITSVGYNDIIQGCRQLLSPEDQQKVPSNFYEAKKFMKNLEILIHPAQSIAWKHFDVVHPSFASNPQNVRLGLATDGFNPWGHSLRSYSCWPVFIVVYNLPLEMWPLRIWPPPPRLDGHSVRLRVAALPDVLFGNPSINQTIPEFGETHNWVKRSIFWELPYWGDNLIRHNLDVMHCEKNFFDNNIHTVMNDSSSKDNVKSRMDLLVYCDRKELHLYYDSSGSLCKPNASYAFDTDKKRCLCTWLKNVRFPDGFASNIARCVNLVELCLVGLKSHDCHICMQCLIPIAFHGLLPESIWGPLTEDFAHDILVRILKQVGTRCLTTQEMKTAEFYVLLNCREVDALLRHLVDASSTSLDMEEIFQDEEPPSTESNKHSSNLASTKRVNLHVKGATMVDLNGDGNDDVDENLSEGNEGYETRGDTHYQWALEDEDAVRKAFLRSMKKGWGDNMKDERDKWCTNGKYRLVWVPEHLWPTLCAYWDSDEFHNLSERGKKNRASGERVTHTTGSVSIDVHEEQMVECSTTYGSDLASWPPRDNDAWATAVGGCHNNFMLGKLGEAMQMMRDKIGQVKEQREVMQRMLEDMGRMQASLSQQFAAFSAYRMRLPSATPSLPHTGQAFPPVGTSFPTARPSFHASGPVPMQMPIEPAFPMGQMGRQSGSPGTSLANPPQDDYGYQPRFDADYQGPFGPE